MVHGSEKTLYGFFFAPTNLNNKVLCFFSLFPTTLNLDFMCGFLKSQLRDEGELMQA